MKRKRTSALGTSMTKSHLRALDRLGLPKPVLSIDHLQNGDEFDDWLAVVQFADLMFCEDGQPHAVMISHDRHEGHKVGLHVSPPVWHGVRMLV